jgi:hypothetical protein
MRPKLSPEAGREPGVLKPGCEHRIDGRGGFGVAVTGHHDRQVGAERSLHEFGRLGDTHSDAAVGEVGGDEPYGVVAEGRISPTMLNR